MTVDSDTSSLPDKDARHILNQSVDKRKTIQYLYQAFFSIVHKWVETRECEWLISGELHTTKSEMCQLDKNGVHCNPKCTFTEQQYYVLLLYNTVGQTE